MPIQQEPQATSLPSQISSLTESLALAEIPRKRSKAAPKETVSQQGDQSSPKPPPRLRSPKSTRLSTVVLRTTHNQVEKQYRDRLNKQFDSLLQTLPEGKLEDDNTSGEKRVSKAEVLIWAQRHIKELEKDKAKLVEEKEGLVGNVDSLRRQWVCLDEGCVP